MVGFWLLFTLIIPATVHQCVGITKPVNLMTDLIDVQRDGSEKLFAQPDSIMDRQLFDLFPDIKNSKLAQDSTQRGMLRSFSASALVNNIMKSNIIPIEQENQAKNAIITQTYWFNPLTFFQNKFNAIAQTHYQNYAAYRTDIQNMVDKRIGLMVSDIWNDTKVNKAKYLEYEEKLKK
jgi:ABC-2 type transport system permease protein